jgi:hypothetical protein
VGGAHFGHEHQRRLPERIEQAREPAGSEWA